MERSLWVVVALPLIALQSAFGSGLDCRVLDEHPLRPTYGPVVVLDGSESIEDLVHYYRALEGIPPAPDPQIPSVPEDWPQVAHMLGVEESSYPEGVSKQGVNCAPFAFHHAYRAYTERRTRYGQGSEKLRRWVNAQKEVFSNCAGERETIPNPPLEEWEEEEKQDRTYQRASALMYALRHEEARKEFLQLAKTSAALAPLARYLSYRTVARQASLQDGEVDYQADLPSYVKDAVSALEHDIEVRNLGDYARQGRLLLSRLYSFSRLPEWRRKASELLAIEASSAVVHEDSSYIIRLFTKASYFSQADEYGSYRSEIRWFDPDSPPPSTALERWLALVRCDRKSKAKRCRELATQWQRPGSVAFVLAAALNGINTPELQQQLESIGEESPGGSMASLFHARLLLDSGHTDLAAVILGKLEKGQEPELVDEVKALLFEITSDKGKRWEYLSAIEEITPRLHLFLENLPLQELVTYAAREEPVAFIDALRYYTVARAMVDRKKKILQQALPLAITSYLRVKKDETGGEHQLRKALLERYRRMVPSLNEDELLLLGNYLTALSGASPIELEPPYLHYSMCNPLWWCRPGPAGLRGTDFFIKRAEESLRRFPNNELTPSFISRVLWGARASCGDESTERGLRRLFEQFHRRFGTTPWAKYTPHWYVPSFTPNHNEPRSLLSKTPRTPF